MPKQSAARRRSPKTTSTTRVRLKPHDPFELIRLIAQTQQDPRKALAELVQNALDAEATEITIERRRVKGEPRIAIVDNGKGVHPDKARQEALTYLAHNIGHSAKRGLTAAERHRLMVQGEYGIGLLGFWSLGELLEIKSRVEGGKPLVLRLRRDSPQAEIFGAPAPIDWPPTRTEVLVRALNERALRQLTATKIRSYLSVELRGQLLQHKTRLVVHDKMARGLAPKRVEVVPERYQGTRLELSDAIDVEGYGPIRMELYLVEEEGDGEGLASSVAISCRGTRVLDRITDLPELDEPPWNKGLLSGELSFDGFTVAAATRRGVVNDEAAMAFIEAVRARIAPLVKAQIEASREREQEVVDEKMTRALRRIFSGLLKEFPSLELLHVEGQAAVRALEEAEPRKPGAGTPIAEPEEVENAAPHELGPESTEPLFLLPVGPLRTVELRPARLVVALGHERRIFARPLDETGRLVKDDLTVRWSIDSDRASVVGEGLHPVVRAGTSHGTATVTVEVAQHGHVCSASTLVEVVEESPERRTKGGIPEPELVDDRSGRWRSRVIDGRWEVNVGHKDYREAGGKKRLRYLASLYAKELVLRTHGATDPLHERLLEDTVGLIAFSERNMPGR